ncbi:hypothetical protein LVJ94_51090 [Pendulispora rubella]|uniref:Uncharacterized protein n=1 Tax=Pendulispora rubella TaxID=2741070 RepID=A0ABZ2L7R1_9BACT
MQNKKMGSWTTCCALLISIAAAGCSGADPQASTAESTDQILEGTAQTSSCGASADPTAESTPAVAADGTVLNAGVLACKCCSDHRAEASRACAAAGLRLVRFTCIEACGLCGRDSAYNRYDASCG